MHHGRLINIHAGLLKENSSTAFPVGSNIGFDAEPHNLIVAFTPTTKRQTFTWMERSNINRKFINKGYKKVGNLQ